MSASKDTAQFILEDSQQYHHYCLEHMITPYYMIRVFGFRYIGAELAKIINFYLHKFPLLSKSARMQTLVLSTCNANGDEIEISDIPGGPSAFEVCVKFFYGIIVTLNAYNVVAARCAAEYLEMNEMVEKGNLIYKIDMFLNSSIFQN